jgi:hypothetical protein
MLAGLLEWDEDQPVNGITADILAIEAEARAAALAEREALLREAAEWLESRPDMTEGDAAVSSSIRAALAETLEAAT